MNRDVASTLLWGGVRLNLPEFTWLISCSIATDHYLFQCLKATFFGYLQVVGAGGQAWLSKTFKVQDSLYYTMSTIGPTMDGHRTNFRDRRSQMAVKCYFEFGFRKKQNPFC